MPRSAWKPMGGCPGHRKVDSTGSRYSPAPLSCRRSSAREHVSGTWPPLRRAAVTHNRHVWLPPGYPSAITSNFPQGVGVYGEFAGIEGDGMEARAIFEPVNFWGVWTAPVIASFSIPSLSPSGVGRGQR